MDIFTKTAQMIRTHLKTAGGFGNWGTKLTAMPMDLARQKQLSGFKDYVSRQMKPGVALSQEDLLKHWKDYMPAPATAPGRIL